MFKINHRDDERDPGGALLEHYFSPFSANPCRGRPGESARVLHPGARCRDPVAARWQVNGRGRPRATKNNTTTVRETGEGGKSDSVLWPYTTLNANHDSSVTGYRVVYRVKRFPRARCKVFYEPAKDAVAKPCRRRVLINNRLLLFSMFVGVKIPARLRRTTTSHHQYEAQTITVRVQRRPPPAAINAQSC